MIVSTFSFLRPKNGGKYCVGRRMKFKSCNTEPCLKQKRDFREEQCAHFDGKHFNINGLLPSVRWVPKYSGSKCSGAEACGCQAGPQSRRGTHVASWYSSLVLMKDRCKLFCRVAGNTAYYQLRDRVIDGTPCGQDTNDICVQGLCRVSPRDRFFTELSCYLIDVCLPSLNDSYFCLCSGSSAVCLKVWSLHPVSICLQHMILMHVIPKRTSVLDFSWCFQSLWGHMQKFSLNICYASLHTHTHIAHIHMHRHKHTHACITFTITECLRSNPKTS